MAAGRCGFAGQEVDQEQAAAEPQCDEADTGQQGQKPPFQHGGSKVGLVQSVSEPSSLRWRNTPVLRQHLHRSCRTFGSKLEQTDEPDHGVRT